MTEELCLIDTDILIYLLKRKEPAYERSLEHLMQHKRFTLSCLSYYECLRGYKAVGATKRLQLFQEILKITDVLYLDQEIMDKAGEIYGVLKREGLLPGEFDLLIGATAVVHDLKIITNNEKHYRRIQKHFPLRIDNWMKE